MLNLKNELNPCIIKYLLERMGRLIRKDLGRNFLLMTVKNTHKTTLFGIRPEIIVCLFLVVTILAVYWQVRNYSFFVYDDGLYVTSNHHVQTRLNIESIFWAFSSTSAANWHPLTWLSHMLDVQLYAMNPGAHHLTNVFFI